MMPVDVVEEVERPVTIETPDGPKTVIRKEFETRTVEKEVT